MRYAIVRSEDNKVRNVIEFKEGYVWQPQPGFFMVASDDLNIGDIYEGDA